MMTMEKFLTLHPDASKQGTNIDRDKYEAMKKAILRSVPLRGEGVAFQELPGLVAPLLPKKLYANASVTWYCVTVKLDLEARGLIRRVAKARPQRLVRVGGSGGR